MLPPHTHSLSFHFLRTHPYQKRPAQNVHRRQSFSEKLTERQQQAPNSPADIIPSADVTAGDAVTGSHADIHITTRGSEFYWGLTTVFALASLLVLAWAQLQSADRRFYHKTVALSCLVMSMTYFTMASNLGWVGIPVEWQRSSDKVAGATRQIFWVRYIGW